MEKEMTIEEVLEITIRNLKGIQIPVEMSESIGARVLGCIRNIQMCVDAIERQKAQENWRPAGAAAAAAAEQAEAEAAPAGGEAWEEETDE